jgi:osmotically-inducible protein OsmY
MSVRFVIWIASGAVIAAGFAGCSDDPPAAGVGREQAISQAPSVAPKAVAPPSPTVDENAALATRVVAALRRDPAVGVLGIDVVGAEGVVTLFGTAPTAADRERAARVAAGVDGVRSVMNQLVIVAGS